MISGPQINPSSEKRTTISGSISALSELSLPSAPFVLRISTFVSPGFHHCLLGNSLPPFNPALLSPAHCLHSSVNIACFLSFPSASQPQFCQCLGFRPVLSPAPSVGLGSMATLLSIFELFLLLLLDQKSITINISAAAIYFLGPDRGLPWCWAFKLFFSATH